jgi:amino acid adenylation domain-containing protein
MKNKEYLRESDHSKEKKELLALLLEEEGFNLDKPPVITPREGGEVAPLSFAQQRLWFLDLLEPGSIAYNTPAAFRLFGPINVKALKLSLKEILRRHDVLRTTFTTAGDQPVQVISSSLTLTVQVVDLQDLLATERESEVQRLATEEAQRPFDLSQGPLLRATLLKLNEEDHVLLLTMHHIVSDGWSMGIFFRELSILYEAFSAGKPAPLAELAIQYTDFAVWQRQWLQGDVLETQLAYWRQQLDGAAPALELPTDRPRPAVQTQRGAIEALALSKEVTDALQVMSRREGVTLFMTLLAAFKTLLYRLTGQKDTIVGTPIANRTLPELEGLIGFFVNTLVMRTDLSGQPSFRELLGRVRETTLGAFDHQDLPFEKLVEALHPERDMSRTPLFQIMFAIQNMPAEELQLPGLTLSAFAIESITVRFDIEILLRKKPEGLSGRVVYNTDLFDDATIARLMGHYETLLESIVADPDQRISDVQILTDTERQQLLVDWNDTSSGYPDYCCVHQLFEQQVEHRPDAVAVVYEDEQLTYRQLNTRANQLAHYLEKLGVGPEVLVGICLERCLEMIIAMMGILKAGGAYVPLDPEYPQERLGFMLADTGSPVLLTHSRLVAELPRHEAKVICLDSDWDAIARHNGETPVSATSVENLAYVIYTSGSTGKPKGVAISHGGLLNLVFWHRNVFEVTASDRATQLAGSAFDASVWEVWPYLTAGARLHVVSAEKLVSPEQLRDWLVSEEITLTFLPTPLAEQVLKLDWPPQTPLRTLLTGGDKLHRSPPESIPFKVVNNYGPTENTVVTTSGVVLPNSDADIQPPIGCPISNTEVYVLDKRLRPVPVGVPGELCIGGESLARGYLNRPNLTAENFIPNPYSDTPGARLYKSGDLVRYLQDGSIEFLGRIDHQVKIRGFRIELGEVESVLGRHPTVEEAVVIAREDVPGDKRLVAYVVASHESTPTFSELRSFLKEKLPDYMIPSAFVYPDALPITPHGKVDRRALPAPEQSRSELEAVYVAPQSEVERIIAEVWQQVLRIEQVGMHDNFFDLGGHSLLLIQIHNKFQELFKKEIPIADIFRYPTIKALAGHLTQEENDRVSIQQTSDSIEKLAAGKNRMKQLFKRRQQAKEKR